MRLLVDAVAVRPGSSAVLISNLIAGWTAAAPEDQIVVLVDGAPQFTPPPVVTVETIVNRSSLPSRLWAQSVGVRRACRRHGADALLSAVTVGAFLGAPCPRGVVVYDFRHELRPTQFSLRRRLSRTVLYGWSFRRADALFCISERTRDDLLARRPGLRAKAHVALLGADHVKGWRASPADTVRYVLAFGHFANKNVDLVLQGWQSYAAGHGEYILRVCGLSGQTRAAAEKLVSELGIGQRVELLPWLADDEFETVFAGAAAVLLPSDFEGFGLPAVEALRLGVPVVVSADPALLEVTAGHAVAAGGGVEDLATAIDEALHLTHEQIAAGIAHASHFTWERCALQVRAIMRQAAYR